MANREERLARETARVERERRIRHQFYQHNRRKQWDLTRAEREALDRAGYILDALEPHERTLRTRRICSLYVRMYRDKSIHWGEVYASPLDLISDLLTHRTGRRLLLEQGMMVWGLLRKGYPPVRRLDRWTPPRNYKYRKVLTSLSMEWFGAYRHQIPPFVRAVLPEHLDRPTMQTCTTDMLHLALHLMEGRGIHTWPTARAYRIPAAANAYLRSVPRRVFWPETVLIFLKMRAYGVPADCAWHLYRYEYHVTVDLLESNSSVWKILSENPALELVQVRHWVNLASLLAFESRSLGLQLTSQQEREILEYCFYHQDNADVLHMSQWFRFCLEEAVRLGKHFRLRKRNQDRLMTQFRSFCLARQEVKGVQWPASPFPSWQESTGEGNFVIVELRSRRDLQLEGISMQHCVATYADDCETGRCSIWSLRWYDAGGRIRPLVTIELDANGRLQQAYAKTNQNPAPEYLAMIKNWMATFPVTA